MKALSIGLLAVLFSTSVMADVKFNCSYSDSFKVEKQGKEKAMYGTPVVVVSGTLQETAGGKLSVKSAYLFGTESKQKIKFFRHNRKGENSLGFAKFHNKSKQQLEDKVWLSTYVKFSLPKKSLRGEEKSFPAYFSYFGAKEDVNKIGTADSSATEVEVTEDELKEFFNENENFFEYKLWCKKTFS